jgi:hypothetical protein
MSERLLPPDLSIVECGRANIIPRNPANSLPAWQRDLPSFVAGLNVLDRRRPPAILHIRILHQPTPRKLPWSA